MAVTDYYTVNGRIRGEATGGVRTNYLPDALGSVTATVNEIGSLVNMYRYKPYGAQLSKSGDGADPKFQWVGQWGYRAGDGGEVYVRARHYSHDNGGWTSEDPLDSGESPYVYAMSNPTTYLDPSGLLTCTPHQGDPRWITECGAAVYNIDWDASMHTDANGNQITGWIIQHVVFSIYVKDCHNVSMASNNANGEYWEAWQVRSNGLIWAGQGPNLPMVVSPTDRFAFRHEGKCRYGFLKVVGKPKFVPGTLHSSFFPAGNVWLARGLHSTWDTPPGWTDSGTLDHRFTNEFACCCLYGPMLAGCPNYNCDVGKYLCEPILTAKCS